MPSGAKKRKALKKKKEQEAIGTSTDIKGYNGDNLHGHSEHGSQDERDSDGNLSSPENKEFEKRDPSATISAGLVKETGKEITQSADVVQESGNAIVVERETSDLKNVVEKSPNPSSDKGISKGADVTQGLGVKIGNDTAVERVTNYQETIQEKSSSLSAGKEISEGGDGFHGLEPERGNAIAVERGTDYQKDIVEKSSSLSSENCTHTASTATFQDAGSNSISEIALVDSLKPVVSVSKVVISEKSEHLETSTQSNLVKQNSVKNEENSSPDLEKIEDKVVTHSGSIAATSKEVGNARESEVPVCSEEKPLLLSRPPVVRTSWLSCCGLFDAVTGSDR